MPWTVGDQAPRPPGSSIGLHSLGFSADGKLVVAAGPESAQAWDALTGKNLQRPFSGDEARQSGAMRDLALSRDGRLVATVHDRGDQATVRLWGAATSH